MHVCVRVYRHTARPLNANSHAVHYNLYTCTNPQVHNWVRDKRTRVQGKQSFENEKATTKINILHFSCGQEEERP